MDMRILVAAAIVASIAGPGFAQTQRTQSTAYATAPTMRSAFATSAISPCYSSNNPTSPCYYDAMNPSHTYSAMMPIEFPNIANPEASPGADSLNEDQAKSRIEAKGYSNISGLEKDNRGIWRGEATMKDGRSVDVTLDLQGNIYSEWHRFKPGDRIPAINLRPINDPS
jgi:Peptidase propeptide and YPEB domain